MSLVSSARLKGASSSGIGFGKGANGVFGVGRPPEEVRLEYRWGMFSSGICPGALELRVSLREEVDSEPTIDPFAEARGSRPPLGLGLSGLVPVDDDELGRSCRRELDPVDSRERRSCLNAAASRYASCLLLSPVSRLVMIARTWGRNTSSIAGLASFESAASSTPRSACGICSRSLRESRVEILTKPNRVE